MYSGQLIFVIHENESESVAPLLYNGRHQLRSLVTLLIIGGVTEISFMPRFFRVRWPTSYPCTAIR
jgi:hypothetical protein